jgi:hypothetical protein
MITTKTTITSPPPPAPPATTTTTITTTITITITKLLTLKFYFTNDSSVRSRAVVIIISCIGSIQPVAWGPSVDVKLAPKCQMTLGQRSLQVVLAHPVPGVGRHAGGPIAVGRCRADRKYELKILNRQHPGGELR